MCSKGLDGKVVASVNLFCMIGTANDGEFRSAKLQVSCHRRLGVYAMHSEKEQQEWEQQWGSVFTIGVNGNGK